MTADCWRPVEADGVDLTGYRYVVVDEVGTNEADDRFATLLISPWPGVTTTGWLDFPRHDPEVVIVPVAEAAHAFGRQPREGDAFAVPAAAISGGGLAWDRSRRVIDVRRSAMSGGYRSGPAVPERGRSL